MFDIRDHGGMFGSGISKSKSYYLTDTSIDLGGEKLLPVQTKTRYLTYGQYIGSDEDHMFYVDFSARFFYSVSITDYSVAKSINFTSILGTSYTVHSAVVDYETKKLHCLMRNGSSFYPLCLDLTTGTGFYYNNGTPLFNTSGSDPYRVFVAGNKLVFFSPSNAYIFNKNTLSSTATPEATTTSAGAFVYSARYNSVTNIIHFIEYISGASYYRKLDLTSLIMSPRYTIQSTGASPYGYYIAEDFSHFFYHKPNNYSLIKASIDDNGVITTLATYTLQTNSASSSKGLYTYESPIIKTNDFGYVFIVSDFIYRLVGDTAEILYDNRYNQTTTTILGFSLLLYSDKYKFFFNSNAPTVSAIGTVYAKLYSIFKFI